VNSSAHVHLYFLAQVQHVALNQCSVLFKSISEESQGDIVGEVDLNDALETDVVLESVA